MGTKNALRAPGKKDKELKHKQLEKPAVPVGKKNGTAGTEDRHNQMTISKLTKLTVTNVNEKRTTGNRKKRQRIETQTIGKASCASRGKELHNGHQGKRE